MTQDAQPLQWVAPADSPPNANVLKPGSLSEARTVVDFWRDAGSSAWFSKSPVFDQSFRVGFIDLHFAVARRERDHWLSDPYACLSLILLLDQFPRNALRDTGHMYAISEELRVGTEWCITVKSRASP